MRPIRTRSVLRTTKPAWVEIDKITARTDSDRYWIFTAIELETNFSLDVAFFGGEAPIQLLRFCMD
ncbi:hypothetical protein HALLA_00475 (plasmid) [Halostagnicola larsenii XH-48]|uniref:Transposase n=1 Tax=Halostagnicola larsenii XH-48 TaxID=797299 RepID=W0JXR7_9EURY|nr:hypothetical protein HALLA_00475 [Halostagnicola larsenii XH-48]